MLLATSLLISTRKPFWCVSPTADLQYQEMFLMMLSTSPMNGCACVIEHTYQLGGFETSPNPQSNVSHQREKPANE